MIQYENHKEIPAKISFARTSILRHRCSAVLYDAVCSAELTADRCESPSVYVNLPEGPEWKPAREHLSRLLTSRQYSTGKILQRCVNCAQQNNSPL